MQQLSNKTITAKLKDNDFPYQNKSNWYVSLVFPPLHPFLMIFFSSPLPVALKVQWAVAAVMLLFPTSEEKM